MIKTKIIKMMLAGTAVMLIGWTWLPVAHAEATQEDGTTTSTSTCTTDETGASFDIKCLSTDTGAQNTATASETPAVQIILNVIVFITKIIGSVALLILIIAGLLMITSMHKEQQITRAKEMFLGALIGLIITFTAYILATFVQSLFYT